MPPVVSPVSVQLGDACQPLVLPSVRSLNRYSVLPLALVTTAAAIVICPLVTPTGPYAKPAVPALEISVVAPAAAKTAVTIPAPFRIFTV